MGGANITGFISPLITISLLLLAYNSPGETLNSAQIIGTTMAIGGAILALSDSLQAKNGPSTPR